MSLMDAATLVKELEGELGVSAAAPVAVAAAGPAAGGAAPAAAVEKEDFTVVLFPRADHGLLDVPPTDARAMPTLLAWIEKQVR